MTDEPSFAYLRPMTDGFRNYIGGVHYRRPEVELVDRANQLTLTAPEMTVLVGGLRTLGANFGGSKNGVFTAQTGMLTNEWFVNLLSMDTEWKKSEQGEYLYEGRDRVSGEPKYTATSVDLVFGSNSQLRALAEVYASSDGKQKFVDDFVAAWNKVMMLDRF
jgi:catalase-peroxidase